MSPTVTIRDQWQDRFEEAFLNEGEDIKEYFSNDLNNIKLMKRDLLSMDGLDDYGECEDKISLLTMDEYRKYHKILGVNKKYNDWWWTITPASTPQNGYSRGVCCVDSSGVLYWCGCGYCFGVRPFLTLDSSVLVSLN